MEKDRVLAWKKGNVDLLNPVSPLKFTKERVSEIVASQKMWGRRQ